jgi:hypothetical protein
LEKTRYRWDEVQFLRLLYREVARENEPTTEFLWTYGHQQRFSHDSLQGLLRMVLRMGLIPEFSLPTPSVFPLNVNLLLVTSFSPEGLSKVRHANRKQQWRALVGALEIAEPERYEEETFWRDWIDHPEVRERVDEDPVQTHLATRYPLGGRSEFERKQVVSAYRRSKRFLSLLESWRSGEQSRILKAFSMGLDIPLFVFFHLLCPAGLRRSAGTMTGDWEQAWGEADLLTTDR